MSKPIPLAFCEQCKFRTPTTQGAHCYMFKQKPGPLCGQFTPDKRTQRREFK